MYKFAIHLLFYLLIPTSLYAQYQTPQDLKGAIDELLNNKNFDGAVWGVKIKDIGTGEILYERNAYSPLRPASNLKLYTSAAALDILGPSYRYRTGVYARGTIQNGVLQGDLIIRGSGDPTIGGRFHEDDITYTFRQWADSLKSKGIRTIQGNIIGDDDIFDDVAIGNGWNPDDLKFWYGAEMSGLMFNDNCVDIEVKGTSRGSRGTITWEPINTSYVDIINRTTTIRRGVREGYARARGSNTITISSQVGPNNKDPESLSISNGTRYFVHVLKEVLQQQGIRVTGNTVDVDDMPQKPSYRDRSMKRLWVYQSPPLAEIAKIINKNSQNLYAEQVLKTIGAQASEDGMPIPGSTYQGYQEVKKFLSKAKLDTRDFYMDDGSGLSKYSKVSAYTMVGLLEYMWLHPDPETKEAFYESLAIAGKDGTLKSRMRGSNAAYNMRGKTGYIAKTRTLSGYVRSAAGTPIAFSLLCNDYSTSTNYVNRTQDAIVKMLADYQQ